MPPPPSPNGDGGRPCGGVIRQIRACGDQTRVAVSRPIAKRESAPVRARPRAASHESSPAHRAPPTIPETV
jgi:hypothetical protein